MTRHVVKHTCGHDYAHDLAGNPRLQIWMAKKREAKRCPPCGLTEWKADIDSANAYYTELATEQGLPELTGTARQVPWAAGLRGEFLDQLGEYWPRLQRLASVNGRPVHPDGLAVARELVLEHADARWWIQNRTSLATAVLLASPRRIKQAGKNPGEPGYTAASLLRLLATG